MSFPSRLRRARLFAATGTALLIAGSCGFPDHSFIADDEFYGSGGGAGETDASTSAVGGNAGDGGATGPGGGGATTGGGAGGTAGQGGGGISGTAGGGTGGLGAAGQGGMGPDASAGGNGGVAGTTSGGAGGGGTGGGPQTDASVGRRDGGGLDDGGLIEAGLSCEGGLAPCSDTCVDLSTDDTNCGVCGTTCAFDEQCTAGICEKICSPGLSLCGLSCVDLQTDGQHCGTCVTVCPAQQICNAGTCEPPCPFPLTECDQSCVNILTDEAYCGDCNTACDPSEVCENGVCRLDCGSLTRCVVATNDVCVDINTDENHCGGCGAGCTGGDVCSGGSCTTVCSPPFVNCGGTCVDTSNNDSHCNTCNNACLTGQDCISGVCTDLVEDCTNGTDDDEDGTADCMDPDCSAGFTCAPVPAGWTGPMSLWSGTPGTTPSCTANYPAAILSAFDDLSVAPTVCPTCTCDPTGGSTCDLFTVRLTDAADCSGLAWVFEIDVAGSCDVTNLADPDPSAHSIRVEGGSKAYANGSCVLSSAPTPSFPTPGWGTEIAGCGSPAATGGGCAVGSCVPRPQAPFGSSLCVFRNGVSPCPPSYPNPPPAAADAQYFQAFLDGRSCSNCTCGTLDCGGEMFIYTDNACSVDETQFATDGSCTTIPVDPTQGGTPGNPLDTRALLHTNPGPVCGDVPRTAQGAVTPDTAVTVCCQ